MAYPSPGVPALPPGMGMESPLENGGLRLAYAAVTMEQFAKILERHLDGFSVANNTALKGTYEVTLEFAANTMEDRDGSTFPGLLAALRQELGLQLMRKKTAFDVLVVDHVDKVPTEN